MEDKLSKKEINTIKGFGSEWTRFDQSHLSNNEANIIYKKYFKIIPINEINKDAVIADIGGGSGRFAKIIAPLCKELIFIEPSNAILAAKKNCKDFNNIRFINSALNSIPLENNQSCDFIYCLGVLHHTASIKESLKKLIPLLKKEGRILLYIYYNFDNKPNWYRILWKISNLLRLLISKLPYRIKIRITDLLAIFIYYPLAKIAMLGENINLNIRNFPLSTYRNYSFKTMRTDSLDRFGTIIEKRMSKKDIRIMLESLSFKDIRFNSNEPYWCVTARLK